MAVEYYDDAKNTHKHIATQHTLSREIKTESKS